MSLGFLSFSSTLVLYIRHCARTHTHTRTHAHAHAHMHAVATTLELERLDAQTVGVK